jgi:hypothetical protein
MAGVIITTSVSKVKFVLEAPLEKLTTYKANKFSMRDDIFNIAVLPSNVIVDLVLALDGEGVSGSSGAGMW